MAQISKQLALIKVERVTLINKLNTLPLPHVHSLGTPQNFWPLGRQVHTVRTSRTEEAASSAQRHGTGHCTQ